MLTELQKLTAQAVVNVFETGTALGDYGKVTLLKGDPGHLTYGRSQTTLASGNLFLLLKAYCEEEGAEMAGALRPFLERTAARDLSLDNDGAFRVLLRQAGLDPVMQEVQDGFFDRVYWLPAVGHATAAGLTTGLGTTVVYDSVVHGGWSRIRARTEERFGTVAALGERG
ncbi:MAG: chitosanase, partial [Gemmatimonadota bacterium]|nr:chitosanase [Gemmatimonadota bacterium]